MVDSIANYAHRLEDYRRHLIDLRDMQYEGAQERAEREATFRQAAEFVSPVVWEVPGPWSCEMWRVPCAR